MPVRKKAPRAGELKLVGPLLFEIVERVRAYRRRSRSAASETRLPSTKTMLDGSGTAGPNVGTVITPPSISDAIAGI